MRKSFFLSFFLLFPFVSCGTEYPDDAVYLEVDSNSAALIQHIHLLGEFRIGSILHHAKVVCDGPQSNERIKGNFDVLEDNYVCENFRVEEHFSVNSIEINANGKSVTSAKQMTVGFSLLEEIFQLHDKRSFSFDGKMFVLEFLHLKGDVQSFFEGGKAVFVLYLDPNYPANFVEESTNKDCKQGSSTKEQSCESSSHEDADETAATATATADASGNVVPDGDFIDLE